MHHEITGTRIYASQDLGVGLPSADPYYMFEIASDDDNKAAMAITQYDNDTGGDAPNFYFRRSRGTSASRVTVQDGDDLGAIDFYGHDGNNFEWAGGIRCEVDGSPAGDSTDMPGRLTFSTTPDGTDSAVQRMKIDSTGVVTIGVLSGSGLSVTTGDVTIGSGNPGTFTLTSSLNAGAITGSGLSLLPAATIVGKPGADLGAITGSAIYLRGGPITGSELSVNKAAISNTITGKPGADLGAVSGSTILSSGDIKGEEDLYIDQIRRASSNSTTVKINIDASAQKFYVGHSSNEKLKIESSGITVSEGINIKGAVTGSHGTFGQLTGSSLKLSTSEVTIGAGFPGTVLLTGSLTASHDNSLLGAITGSGLVVKGRSAFSGPAGTFSTFSSSDTTPSVKDGNLFKTHASTQTLTDFDDGIAGQTITVISTAGVTFDVTSSGLKGGDTNIGTATGDVTVWTYDGTDWHLISYMDVSEDMSDPSGASATTNFDTAITINDSGASTADFRVESNNKTHMLFVDAGKNAVGVNTTSSANHGLTVVNDFQTYTFESQFDGGGYSGDVLRYSPEASPDTLVHGQVYYLHPGNGSGGGARWVIAGATQLGQESDQHMLGLGLGGTARDPGVLIRGFARCRKDTFNDRPSHADGFGGRPLYLDHVDGYISFDDPHSSTHHNRVLGYAIDDYNDWVFIYFNPQPHSASRAQGA